MPPSPSAPTDAPPPSSTDVTAGLGGAERSAEGGPGGERKLVTVLFSDLSGYSRLFERMDPEDVSEMMTMIFKTVIDIISRYDGYIDRIIGDEVLAVFGIPQVHEDDPVRAIHAALDIHAAVSRMNTRFGNRLENPLLMHSGIATGLVVTGVMDLTTGCHGITGDTVNRALWLTNRAGPGEILVSARTMAATSGFFLFEKCSSPANAGTTEDVEAYRVLKLEKRPDKIRRVRGLRSRLIGRDSEMAVLDDALAAVTWGQGRCVCITGEAGTGKSRLIGEFRNRLQDTDVQWLQGNAYHYTQNMPYFPIIDLLGRAVDVRENDSEATIRQKLNEQLQPLDGEDGGLAQILERLFTLSADKTVKITPEAWRIRLLKSLVGLATNQAQRGITIICLEDLHWADPSTVETFCRVLTSANLAVLFLISYRPGQTNVDIARISNPYYATSTVLLEDFSPAMSETMLKSLLGTLDVPSPLLNFVRDHLGGNPFFLEEVVNALVDTGRLKKHHHTWQIQGTLAAAAFSSDIAAVINARLDRLDETTKRIVQEASVIGRQFSVLLLKSISEQPDHVDGSLATLKTVGLILENDDLDEASCRFKHALVQEVAYSGLLKQQRRDYHERIASALERSSPDRIDALCETLAYHFSNGRSVDRAVEYLRQSGHKGLKRYAVIEAHNYYAKAYRLLTGGGRADRVKDPSREIIRLLLEWFFVFNMRGRYQDLLDLFRRHEPQAMACDDLQLKGMYLACLGWACQRREQLAQSRHYLMEALAIGSAIDNHKVIAYSCACLIWTCTDQGRFDEAVLFTDKAEKASRRFETEDPTWTFETDQDLVRFVLTGTAIASWFRGDCRQCHRLAERLLHYGDTAGDVNSRSEGRLAHGMGDFAAGNYRDCIDNCNRAIDTSADPLYALNARFLLAYAHLCLEQVAAAEENLAAIVSFCQASGYEYIGSSAVALSSIIDVARGKLGKGVSAIKSHARRYLEEGKHYHAQTFHYMLGQIYLKMVLREGSLDFFTTLKNLPFLIVQWPTAAIQAETHFKTAIRIADRINALGIKAQASFDLSRLYLAKKRRLMALPLLTESIDLFEQLGAKGHLERARAVLAAIGGGEATPVNSSAKRGEKDE